MVLQSCAVSVGAAPELREGVEPVLADAVSRGGARSHLVGGIAARHRYLIIAIPAARGYGRVLVKDKPAKGSISSARSLDSVTKRLPWRIARGSTKRSSTPPTCAAIEDQGGAATGEEIRKRFGENVVEIIQDCSDTDVVPKPPWKERNETYVAHVVGASDSVRFVSAADKLHNARAILADLRRLKDRLWKRFTGSKDDTLWYYRALVEAYEKTSTKPAVVEELHRTVDEIGRLAAKGQRLDQGER